MIEQSAGTATAVSTPMASTTAASAAHPILAAGETPPSIAFAVTATFAVPEEMFFTHEIILDCVSI